MKGSASISTAQTLTIDWLRNPFNAKAPVSFTYEEKKEFIDIKMNSARRLEFDAMDLDTFWIEIANSHPLGIDGDFIHIKTTSQTALTL